jgi:hypothetical protein
MYLNLTHKPTHWFFSIEEILADCEEQGESYRKYADSNVSEMALGYLSLYEDRKQIALGLQQLHVPYLTVKVSNPLSPISDLNQAIADRRFDRTSPFIFNTFAARPCPHKLQAYGAFYKLDHILEESNQEVIERTTYFENDKFKGHSNHSKILLSVAKDFNAAVGGLVNNPSQGLIVTFERDQNPDLSVKSKIRSLTL